MADKKPVILDSNNQPQVIQSGDTVPIANGGTGATSAASAVANLGLSSATSLNQGVFTVTFNGFGGVVTANTKGYLAAAIAAGTITGWRILGDVASGSCVVDMLRWNGSAYVSIIGSGNKPTIAGAQRANASANGSWTSLNVAVNDEWEWNLDSCSSFTFIAVEFLYTKT